MRKACETSGLRSAEDVRARGECPVVERRIPGIGTQPSAPAVLLTPLGASDFAVGDAGFGRDGCGSGRAWGLAGREGSRDLGIAISG